MSSGMYDLDDPADVDRLIVDAHGGFDGDYVIHEPPKEASRLRVWWRRMRCDHRWRPVGFADWKCDRCGKVR